MNREMAKMTWKEFEQVKDTKTVILPVGSMEQHGYHLPMQTDVIISTGLALRLAEKIDGIVAPAVNYGYKSQPASGGGPLFPGTIDLNGETMIHIMTDVISEFAKDGVKKMFILNGHFENEPYIIEAMDIVTKAYDIQLVLSSWWDNITDDVVEKVFDEVPFPSWALEHAAITETSMVMVFAPELVHMDRFVEEPVYNPGPYYKYPVRKGMVPTSGALATARTSSLEKGELLVNGIVNEFAKIYQETLA